MEIKNIVNKLIKSKKTKLTCTKKNQKKNFEAHFLPNSILKNKIKNN
jgi:hypothetical protein